MKHVLVFFPHNPFPPQSGAHRRCLQILRGFHALGARVSLASSTYTSDTQWDPVSEQSRLEAGVTNLFLHQAGNWDRQYAHYSNKLYHMLRRSAPLTSANYAPLGLRRWFAQLARGVRADVVVINYAFWGGLVTSPMRESTLTAIDTHDLVSLYRPRFILMERFLTTPPFAPETTNQEFLAENFFDEHAFKVSPEEYRIYDRFDYTIAITPDDAKLIQQHTRQTQVLNIPMTQPVCKLNNSYDGDALYTAGRNPFNVQGYLYFAARVLPRILESEPAFRLQVTGGMCGDVSAVPGISLRGFVPDLAETYTRAPFSICPILGKTGQQIKIVEAMAHGVPVIATRAASDGSPIRHGKNGLIAQDADEFARYALELWEDRARCKQLGNAARETIAREFSGARLTDGLAKILETR